MAVNYRLEAFIVKREKVLLPQIYGLRGRGFSDWIEAKDNIISKEILIEPGKNNLFRYTLYGTDIPVTFCHPLSMTAPRLTSFIGVETLHLAASKFMKKISTPAQKFYYHGKMITNEEIIMWLGNEDNIESMKRVKEWATQYGAACKESASLLQKEVEKNRLILEQMIKEEMQNVEVKAKKMNERNAYLVSKYNSEE